MTPTIYLTNAASRKPPHRGPGRVWTIMARPRPQYGEAGEGWVGDLVPDESHLIAVKSGEMTMALYRALYLDGLRGVDLAPGELMARGVVVADCDTLICCCSRAAAARGECHRVWAARALKAAGWWVVLDGVALL